MKTQCPNCKSKFNVNETNIGKQAKCPKCAKPFTIEPFVETPVAVETPVKSPEPTESPAKSVQKVETPAPVAPPVKSPEAVVPPAKSVAPVEAPVKSQEPVKIPQPVETPIKKLTADHAETAEKKPKTISAKSAVSEVESVSKTALSKSASGETSPQSGGTALSKTVFVYCWMAVRIITGVLGALGLMLAIRKEAHLTLIKTFAAADVFLVLGVLIELALYYKMWAAIQDSHASVSPAKAVGFLFIPVFNIYWMLSMLIGFAEDYNAFIQRRSVKTKELPVTLFMIYAFLSILTAIVVTVPMLCVFKFAGRINGAFIDYSLAAWALFFFISAAGIAHFITYILVSIKTCNAINALPGALAKGR